MLLASQSDYRILFINYDSVITSDRPLVLELKSIFWMDRYIEIYRDTFGIINFKRAVTKKMHASLEIIENEIY